MYHRTEKLFGLKWDLALYFMPLLIFSYLIRDYLADLYVGAIMLGYFALLTSLLLNHGAVYIRVLLAKRFGYASKYDYKQILPTSYPLQNITFTQLVLLETIPLGIHLAFLIVFIFVSHLTGSKYMTTLWLGTFLFSFIHIRASLRRVVWARFYKGESFRYTKRTIHVYSREPSKFSRFFSMPSTQ